MMSMELLSLNNVVFRTYLFWSGILVLKMLFMSILTGFRRMTTKAVANPEDCVDKQFKVKFDEPKVERVRRAHQNDLENILPFFVIGFLYVLINPAIFLAVNLYRAFAIARIAHTLVYAIYVVPQPARGLAFFVGVACTAYMAVQVIFAAL